MANDKIVIKGAREHNLKNIDLTLPREKFIVMTGLSGSGKSSLAFDTIYADGQRRYVESLSSYARMFLGRMDKPDVDEITGLSPAISIDQKTTSHNPRSTVGTVTEIYDYLRLLYARVGVPHCPVCGRVISQQTVDEMVDAVLKLEDGTKFQVLAPVVRQRKGTQQKELDAARRGGYSRVRIDGNLYDLDEEITLEKNIKHTVEIVVDRLAMRKGIRGRLADSLETALALTGGIAEIDVIGGECMTFSQNFACPEHGISIGDLSPRLFSFNNPQGACEKCTGLGTFMRVDEERILPNKNLSIRQAVKVVKGTVSIGSPKSKDSIRDIPVPLNVRPCAIKLRDTTDQFIWESPKTGLPCNPTHFRDVFRKSLEEADDVRLLTPHSCRHTYVSQMQALGVDIQTIQSIVGHADTEMTEHYLHVQESIRQSAIQLFSEAFLA